MFYGGSNDVRKNIDQHTLECVAHHFALALTIEHQRASITAFDHERFIRDTTNRPTEEP